MELFSLIRFFRQYFFKILVIGLSFGLLGLVVFFVLPVKYYAIGTFYISRQVEPASPEFFSYEGYYGQQSAMNYTRTVAGLIEGVDVRSRALSLLDIPVNEESLRKAGKRIRVSGNAPMLLTLQVKGETSDAARSLWDALSVNIIEISRELNVNGDPNLNVQTVSTEPVVRRGYHNALVYALAGFGIGIVAGTAVSGVHAYLKEEIA